MVFDLIVIGHVSIDTNIYKDSTHVDVPGGCGYYTSAGASTVSKHVGLVTRIGTDYDIEHLQRLEIDLGGVRQVQGTNSRFTHKYTSGSRQWSGSLGVGEGLCPEDIPPSYLDSRCIHIGTMPPEVQLRFLKHLKNVGFNGKISGDSLVEYIRGYPRLILQFIYGLDIFFPDGDELDLLTKGGYRLEEGPPLVIKGGPNGAVYVTKDCRIAVSAPQVKYVDKTGSGDVFAGVFLTLVAIGESESVALEKAVNLASRSVTQVGIEHIL